MENEDPSRNRMGNLCDLRHPPPSRPDKVGGGWVGPKAITTTHHRHRSGWARSGTFATNASAPYPTHHPPGKGDIRCRKRVSRWQCIHGFRCGGPWLTQCDGERSPTHTEASAPCLPTQVASPVRCATRAAGAHRPMSSEAEDRITTSQSRITSIDGQHPDYQHTYWNLYVSALRASGIDPDKVPFVKYFEAPLPPR